METDLDKIIQRIIQFRDDRDWLQYHDPKNLVQAISIEAAELQEIFLWLTTEESKDLTPEKVQKVKDELADIFIFMTYLSDHFGINLLEAIKNKLKKNEVKYPVEKSKGSSKKYDQFWYIKYHERPSNPNCQSTGRQPGTGTDYWN
jgi:dCTP diphosphatase